MTFVSKLSQLESRSQTGAVKRGRICCMEDRGVTRIHNTGRGLAGCDPIPLTHLYRRINMQGKAEAQQQMAVNPLWWPKEGWNPGISSLTPGVAQISDRLYSHKPFTPPVHIHETHERRTSLLLHEVDQLLLLHFKFCYNTPDSLFVKFWINLVTYDLRNCRENNYKNVLKQHVTSPFQGILFLIMIKSCLYTLNILRKFSYGYIQID